MPARVSKNKASSENLLGDFISARLRGFAEENRKAGERRKRPSKELDLEAIEELMGFAGPGAISRVAGSSPRLRQIADELEEEFGGKAFEIIDESGEALARLTTHQSGKVLHIDEIFPTGRFSRVSRQSAEKTGRRGAKDARATVQSLGQSALRELLPDLIHR
ncbi:hypothetical protein LCGC14_2752100, partial [marine sediment metagenome]